ncbi:MAG TPA: NlpC/P60 family protein [Pyrinomonadaceae bacterium]|nr:NlpC/P60 family protein [Pyrinomonadaceae bacterium]
MKNFRRILVVSACAALFTVIAAPTHAQTRDRVVKLSSSQPTNAPQAVETVRTTSSSRPILSNQIIVVPQAAPQKLIQKTSYSTVANGVAAMAAAGRTTYGMDASVRLDRAIKARYGLPYRYGSTGPNSYDCSGFVWSVFQEAGLGFTRASARSLWSQSEPVYGDDRFKFGTLVFFNNLGHMGIVADENGFYQASSSKGITYSPFAGYWSGRIVGYRRLTPEAAAALKAELKGNKEGFNDDDQDPE